MTPKHVRVLFFGAVAESAGRRETEMEIADGETASALLKRIVLEQPTLSKLALLVSINQQHSTFEEVLANGDEVAIFTAVSGG